MSSNYHDSSINVPGEFAPCQAQALALWTYISSVRPAFTSAVALQVVNAVNLTGDDSPKQSARRLRNALAEHGILIKHSNALQAVARMRGMDSYFELQQQASGRPQVAISALEAAEDQEFDDWQDALPSIQREVDKAVGRAADRVVSVRFHRRGATFSVFATDESKRSFELPFLLVGPAEGRDASLEWLNEAAVSAMEAVRRRVEETFSGVLNGIAVLDVWADVHSASNERALRTEDVPNMELILLREDVPDDPYHGYEVARGDELGCWRQLVQIEEASRLGLVRVDGDAWTFGDARYVWRVATLYPRGYVPGLSERNLVADQVARLRHRFQIARQTLGPMLNGPGPARQQLDFLNGPPESVLLNMHATLHALKGAGITWQEYIADNPDPPDLRSKVPFGFAADLIARIRLEDPNSLFRLPARGELQEASDDQLLRALIPRVHQVVYRCSRAVSADARRLVSEGVSELASAIRMRGLLESGTVRLEGDEEPLPHLVYSGDGEELRAMLAKHGLKLYVGVMPRFFKLVGLRTPLPEGAFPYAFGYALFLDIEIDGA